MFPTQNPSAHPASRPRTLAIPLQATSGDAHTRRSNVQINLKNVSSTFLDYLSTPSAKPASTPRSWCEHFVFIQDDGPRFCDTRADRRLTREEEISVKHFENYLAQKGIASPDFLKSVDGVSFIHGVVHAGRRD